MAHNHDLGHDHGHDHGHDNQRRVGWAALLTAVFMVAEAAGGIVSGSLALLADAGHMLTDAAGLTLAWLAFRMARRPSDAVRTYGFHRLQVLAAYSNGLTLFFIALCICYEAARRLFEPMPVLAGPMLAVALAGLVINILAFYLLHGGDRENLNIRGALLHVLGDLLGSVATIIAALVILWSGWTPIDPILSALVAVLILRSAWSLMRESGHILLEASPEAVDIPALKEDLVAAIPGILDVHHVHVWSLTEKKRLATLHVQVADQAQCERVLVAVKARLREVYHIDHATVEIEGDQCGDAPAHAAEQRGSVA